VRLAFDSRPGTGSRELGCYTRCLLQALRETAGEQDEVLESHRPRGADVFHAPWMQGAMLHSPCPMVVTLHDLAPLRRPSERMRAGGIHLRMRHLALQRATHMIVPSEIVAREAVAELGLEPERVVVIPQAHDAAAPVAQQPGTGPAWTWQSVARQTWQVYLRALAQPHRPCVTRWRRPAGIGALRAGRARTDPIR
jgi:Glycosyltransferase Family 4